MREGRKEAEEVERGGGVKFPVNMFCWRGLEEKSNKTKMCFLCP